MYDMCVQTAGPPLEKLDLLFRSKSHRESRWALEEEDDVMDDSTSTTYSTGEQAHVFGGGSERCHMSGAGAAVAPYNMFLLLLLFIVLIFILFTDP